MYNTN
jgi:hypothetical protein